MKPDYPSEKKALGSTPSPTLPLQGGGYIPADESASLLLVDDDETFCRVLRSALVKRGFCVSVAHSVEDAMPLAVDNPPEFAVVDMKMKGAPGLVLVKALHELDPNTRIVVLTGYASINTAVEAIKLGATQYLAKPANADEIVAAFSHQADGNVIFNARPANIENLEWEHIQRVLQEHGNNISATARALNMHRRTLQRKLNKPPPGK
ncbi:MAG: response regulator transcription factor [Proteobacteria bacterium]|nr:response regulator transcription factor [Pseudomonadota bacterium]